jgi:hypothetical protein
VTSVDPHGALMDVVRNCYESWMRVPEGRIRVRWYRIAPPLAVGTYPLTDYSSSNWDADPKSLDPPLGEESSTRSPFTDWRDCSPPPWQPGRCGKCCGGDRQAYTVFPSPHEFHADDTATLTFTGVQCLWRSPIYP